MTEKHQQEKDGFFQWFGEWVTSISVLSSFVIFLFLLFITSIIIAFIPPELWHDHIVKTLPDYITKIIPAYNPENARKQIDNLISVTFIGSILGLVFGFLLFAQRLDVMNKQFGLEQKKFDLAQSQHKTLQHQIEATEHRHETEGFDQALKLLDDKKIRNRTEGIAKLRKLTRTNPEAWHIRVVNLLAHFIQEQSMAYNYSPVQWLPIVLNDIDFRKKKLEELEESNKQKWETLRAFKTKKVPNDIEVAMQVIACDLTDDQKDVVQEHLEQVEYWPDLRKSWLCGINLNEAYLPQADLEELFLTGANLDLSDLSGAILSSSHLDKTSLIDANLQNARFHFTNLAGVNLLLVKGLESVRIFDFSTSVLANISIEGLEKKEDGLPACYYVEGEESPNHSLLERKAPKLISSLKLISINDYWEYARAWHKIKKEGGL